MDALSTTLAPAWNGINWEGIPSPAFVVNTALLERNARMLAEVRAEADVEILLALKGFAMFSTFPLLSRYLDGTTASGLHEALLGRDSFGGQVHVYSPAFTAAEIAELVGFADHLVFNTPAQWLAHRPAVRAASRPISCGLRVNPGYSEVEVPLYNPCAPGSRLGTPAAWLARELDACGEELLEGLEGLHFHTLCEQDAGALERTLPAFEAGFGHLFGRLKWVNFGGGHHITRPGYDRARLVALVRAFRERTGLRVFLEPGEAVGLDAGVLVATVLDVFENGVPVAVLDTSATTHMPDTLEMPYRPHIHGAGQPGEFAHTYRLGGLSCLAGDVVGEYSFPEPLRPGQRLIFADMAHYTMVKTTTFNGVPLPSLCLYRPENAPNVEVVRRFGYQDYRERLS